MRQYLFITTQLIFSAFTLMLSFTGIIPEATVSVLLTAVFCILICDLIYEAIISLINLHFFDNSIYICAGTICLIFVANITEALICLLILRIFTLLLKIFYNIFDAKISRLIYRLLPKKARLYSENSNSIQPGESAAIESDDLREDETSDNMLISCDELKPGDRITLYPSERLPVDCILSVPSAFFASVFAASGSEPVKFLQGDEIPGGSRLVSDTPVTLTVTSHYEDSTFVKYVNAFKKSIDNSKDTLGIALLLPKIFIVLGIISAIISIFIPSITGYSSLLIFMCCSIFLPTANITAFLGKMLFYSFQKGIIISGNFKKLANTKSFFIAKSAIIKTSEYTIASVHPVKASIDNDTLLKYAAQAEAPYSHTGIGNTLINACTSKILLSAVRHTELYPELGIRTKYHDKTIHAGCKEFFITSGINNLPDFNETELISDVTDTFVYIALNNSYIGYIRLNAPRKNSYAEFIDYMNKRHIATRTLTQNSPDEADALVAARQTLSKKYRTSYVAYIDSRPTDCMLQSMSDYNIFIGSGAYCNENDFDDVTVIPNSFKTLLRTIKLSKKVYLTANLCTVLILLTKAGFIAAGFLLPGIKVSYILLTDGIICTLLIKVYDIFFRLFTRRG